MNGPVPDFGEPWSYEPEEEFGVDRIRDNFGGSLTDNETYYPSSLGAAEMERCVECVNALAGVNVKEPDLITQILLACLKANANGDMGALASGVDNVTDIIKNPDGYIPRTLLSDLANECAVLVRCMASYPDNPFQWQGAVNRLFKHLKEIAHIKGEESLPESCPLMPAKMPEEPYLYSGVATTAIPGPFRRNNYKPW